jgi:AraC-like DNA-binding protein
MWGMDRLEWVDKLAGDGSDIPQDTASANLIGRVVSAAVNRGANRPTLLKALDLTEATIRNQLNRVTGQVFINLLSLAETQLRNPAIALEFGRDAKPSCFSDIGFATRMLPTLRDVLAANIQMLPLRQTMHRISIVEEEDSLILSWNIFDNPPDATAAAVEFTLSGYVRLAREVLGSDLRIKGISIQHRPRFDPKIYEALLGCRVSFSSSRTAVRFDAAQCSAPSPNANPALFVEASKRHAVATQWFEQGKRNSAFTYFYVMTELNKSPVTLERIARAFGMAERTLRRNLVTEGNPFRQMLDDVRRNMCDLYRLENRRSLGEVAELLGYGELSALTRAYRRWYGEPPSRSWRN